MKKEKRNSSVSFSSNPSFVIQTIDNDLKPSTIKEDEPVVAPLVELPPPPDGGWGWVIVFASFMCNLILGNVIVFFGIDLHVLVQNLSPDTCLQTLVSRHLSLQKLVSNCLITLSF